MGLESATYISGLNASNPINATDVVGEGDDHLRLVKSTLLNTFPSITGAVTATHTELNILDADNTFNLDNAVVDLDGTTFTADYTSLTMTGGSAVVTISGTTVDISGQVLLSASGASASTAALLIDANAPYMRLSEADQAIDASDWLMGVTSGTLHIGPASDASTSANGGEGIHISRSGTTTTEIQLDATTLDFNGNADISGTLSVGGVLTAVKTQIITTQPQIAWDDTDAGTDQRLWQIIALNGQLRFNTRTDADALGENFITVDRTAEAITKVAIDGDEVELNATTLDLNGTLDVDGGSHNISDGTGSMAWSGTGTIALSGGAQLEMLGGMDIAVRDGGYARFFDPGDTDYLQISHNGTDAILAGTNTTNLNFTGFGLDFGTCSVTVAGDTADEVGYAGAPSRDVSGTGNTAATDNGKTIRFTAGSFTFTLDSDPPEDAVVILDNAGGASVTIAASGTLIWAATAGTGNRTLADDGLAVAMHRGSGVWVINGGGLS